jgi:hypothetical protein
MGMTALAFIPIFISGYLTSPEQRGRLSANQAQASPPRRSGVSSRSGFSECYGRPDILAKIEIFIASIEASSSNYRRQDRCSAFADVRSN